MRKFRRLALFLLLALSAFLIGVFISRAKTKLSHHELSAWQVLLSFENQDLEGLDEQSGRLVRKAINELAPRKEDRSLSFAPRLFRTIANAKGEQRYILIEESPMVFIPGEATLRVCIFDNGGHLLNQQEFSTGMRASITGIRIREIGQLGPQTLIVQGEYVFTGTAFEQYYALSGNQIVMIYYRSGMAFRPISYGEIGPMIERSADEWEEALESSDTVEILSALMWLSGSHSDIYAAKEDNPDERKFLTVSARASVQKRLAELSESDNFWIRSAAISITANH